jgi:hypothetical protein
MSGALKRWLALLSALFSFKAADHGWVEPSNDVTRAVLAHDIRLPVLSPPEGTAIPVDIQWEAFLVAVDRITEVIEEAAAEPAPQSAPAAAAIRVA